MPGRKQIPSFKLASGTTNERDNSYNLLNTLGSIFYNTDTSNVEVYHEDPSNNVGWRDLVMNNKEQIDISGKLVVDEAAVSKVTFPDGTTMATATTDNETKIENGNSSMEIATSNGACVFTPNGNAANATTFAADGSIITSGYVGIGDDAPDAPLQIKGDGGTSSSLRVESTNAAGAGFMYFQRNTNGHSYLLNASNHPLRLGANNNGNQLFLRGDGNVGIGTSNPTAKLEVIGGQLKATNGNVGHGTAKFLVSGGPAVINSYCYANAFVTTSDDRIKENEKLIINATETLLKLTPQIYDKYDDMDLSGNPRVESGLIAQEVYYNAPELRHLVEVGLTTDASGNEITPTPDEMDLSGVDIGSDPDYGSHGWGKNHPASLDYNGLIPYMIKSNQEQQTTIEQLEARLATLENK